MVPTDSDSDRAALRLRSNTRSRCPRMCCPSLTIALPAAVGRAPLLSRSNRRSPQRLSSAGLLIGAGMTGYGIGSLAGSALAPLVATRRPRVPTIITGWVLLGAAFASLPWLDGSLVALALASAVGGFVTPLSFAALNALIIERTSGEERRTAFATQHVAISGGSSVGMLCGGAVIALLGAEITLHVAGAVLIALPLLLLVRPGSTPRRRKGRPAPSTVEEPATRRANHRGRAIQRR